LSERPIRVAFVLTALGVGGAEMMLWKLLSRMDRERFTPLVVALSAEVDSMLERFVSLNVDCRLLGMSSLLNAAGGLVQLKTALRQFQPDIVQGWLYHGNIAATLATLDTRRRTPVLWSIRGAPAWDRSDPWHKRLTMWAGKKLSNLPQRIIHNSMVGAVAHEQLGYAARNRVVLPNGFDTDLFQPSAEARRALRDELRVVDETVLVGLIGRFDPMKDHANFLRSAALLKDKHPRVEYVLVGGGTDATNKRLSSLISEFDLHDRVHLLGFRNDMTKIAAALDLSVLSSTVEGFPNVVGEAMSCGVPCVVTDVGDCAWIVGDTGRTVPARDSHSLANAMSELIDLGGDGRTLLGKRARQRIVKDFALDAVVRQYQDVYEQVCAESEQIRARLGSRAPV